MPGRYDEGMRIRREVLGDEHVDRAIAATTDLDAAFQRHITEHVWGDLWADPTLRTRRWRNFAGVFLLFWKAARTRDD